MTGTPYDTAPDTAFWSRAVARGFRAADMLPQGTVLLRADDRVMSAGSCFAANLVPHLEASGFTYVRTERRHPALKVPPENLGYDKFSAAYGNIYTARQLLQLLHRATGVFEPQERVWRDAEGSYVDPYRPGLRYRARSSREYGLLTRQHLDFVRRAFSEATVFVFTLGLTEAWVSQEDGAVFPACPGTVAGSFDAARHAFHNFSAAEVTADLLAFLRDVRALNPGLRVVLSVSPVPLVATATGGHVLEATTYSKAVLRVAAGDVARAAEGVTYFPAYEIVTGPQAAYEAFAPDRRSVSAAAVAEVMGCFFAHCEGGAAPPGAVAAAPDWQALSRAIAEAECEEVLADPTLRPLR